MNTLNIVAGLKPVEFMGVAVFTVLGVALLVSGVVQVVRSLWPCRRYRR